MKASKASTLIMQHQFIICFCENGVHKAGSVPVQGWNSLFLGFNGENRDNHVKDFTVDERRDERGDREQESFASSRLLLMESLCCQLHLGVGVTQYSYAVRFQKLIME